MFWLTVDESEEALPSNVDSNVKKENQRHLKKTMTIIVLNVANNQLAHRRSCKTSTKGYNRRLRELPHNNAYNF